MNDSALFAGACIAAAFIVVCGVLGIYGIVCCIAQCVRHCKKIWRKQP